jgi:hypothetical protein
MAGDDLQSKAQRAWSRMRNATGPALRRIFGLDQWGGTNKKLKRKTNRKVFRYVFMLNLK